jgi:uncharacterized protein (DUF1499 family)
LSFALLGIAGALAAGLGVLVSRGSEPWGIDDVWSALFGKPDLGPVDFATLVRRSSPNNALACPPGICPKARADLESPVLAVEGDRLRRIVAETALSEPGTEILYQGRWEDQDRYLVRSRLMRFPDTVSTLVVGMGEGRSSVAIYSRSQIGYSDLGVNRARVERWLTRIREAAARN